MSKLVVLKPRMSEKAYGMSQDAKNNTYVFVVDKRANKLSVADAVEKQFEVEVTGVTMAVINGKAKRTFVNRRGKFVRGQRSDIKKAFVTLKEGQSLPIFDAVEEAEEKEAKLSENLKKAQDKAEKKAEKSATKEEKKGLLRRRSPARTETRGNK